MTYAEFRDAQQAKFNVFADKHAFFAYSKTQFDEGMAKLGLDPKKDTGLLYRGVGGMFYRKTDADALKSVFDDIDAAEKEWRADDARLKIMIIEEMGDHEYCISHDADEVLTGCGLPEDAFKDPRIAKVWAAAEKEYWHNYEEWENRNQ